MTGKIDVHEHLTVKTMEWTMSGKTFASGTIPHEVKMKMCGVEDMLPHLDELGIRRGVIMTMGEGEAPSANKMVAQAVAMFPDRYSWMCNVDYKDIDTVKERLASYKAAGACGIGEFALNKWITDPFVQAVFKAAEELDMPLLFHMSPEEGFNYGIADKPGLPMLEEALQKYPNLKVIGHSQPFWHEITADAAEDIASRNSWGQGPVKEGGRLVELFEKYPNLYGDLSANSGGNAIMRDEPFGLKFLERFQDRLMFGTDMTNTEMVFPLGAWLDRKLEEGVLSKEIYEKVCFRNAQRILGVE